MPELNFRIFADDTAIKKTLAGIDKIAKENAAKLEKELSKTIDKQNEALKITEKRKKASDEVVKATEDEVKANDKLTESIKRKNAAFDASGKQIRPVQISNSQDEINALNTGRTGTISGGAVVGPSADFNRLASEAAAFGTEAKEAYNAAVTGSNNTTQAVVNAQKAIRSLKIEMQSYQNIAETSTDPKRLGEYNNKIRETQAEIARLRNVGKTGYDDLGNKLTATAGKQEVLTAKLRMYQEALSKANAPKSFVDLNRKIESTQIELGKLQNAGKKGFDEMGNAIQKSGKGVGTLWSGLKTVANILPGVGIAGLLAFAVDPIIENRKAILEWITTLVTGKKSLSDLSEAQEDLNGALNSGEYKAAITKVSELKQMVADAKDGFVDKDKVVKEYNSTLGKTIGQVTTLQGVEDELTSKGDAYIEMILKQAAAQTALQKAVELTVQAEERRANGPTFTDMAIGALKGFALGAGGVGAAINETVNARSAGSAKLEKEAKTELDIYKKFNEEVNRITKANGFSKFGDYGDKGKSQNSIISAQESLQKKIDDINAEYSRKALSRDEAELQAVRDKFKQIADEAAKFNANPKNKLHLVDTTGLTATRDQAIEDLIYKQDAEKAKIGLEKQKALYADYEDYKTKLGADAANERFEKELNTAETYLDLLKTRQKEITDIAPEKRTGAQADYLDWLDKQVKVEVLAEQKKYDALVKEFISYSDKRKALTEKYQADLATLEGNSGAQAERTTKYQEDLKSLDDANVQKLDAYKALFKGIDQLSDENARSVVANAENMLNGLMATGKISKELAAEIRILLANTTKEIGDRMPERIINLANEIDQVAEAVAGVDSKFGKMLHTVGNVVGQVGNIKKGLNDFNNAKAGGDVFGQLSGGLAMFGAAMSITKTLEGIFSGQARREAQQAYATENQTKQNEALNKALERQISLINDAYGTDRLTKYAEAQAQITKNEQTYTDQLRNRYSMTGNKELDALLTKVNDSGNLNLLDALKDKSQLDKYKIPAGDIEALKQLLANGTKLDDNTEKIVQNLIDAKQASIDLVNQMNSEHIGSSLDSIADDFISTLTDGTQDFGKSLESIIRKSILNGFKGKLIQQQLQGFYTQFAAAAADGTTTPEEIEKLRATYLAAAEKAKKDLADLAAATGVDLNDPDPDSSTSALQKNIKQISSDQANALEGIARGSYDKLKTMTDLQATSNATAAQMVDLAMQGLRWQQQTAENTAATVYELRNAVSELKGINLNTRGDNISMRGAGFGGQSARALT
jgi:hypothetical protein